MVTALALTSEVPYAECPHVVRDGARSVNPRRVQYPTG